MPRTSDILRRFRLAGAPGAASVTGVPADRGLEVAGELQPVLLRLAATQDEAAQILQEAQAVARARRNSADAQATALVAAAHRDAAAERSAAALEVTRVAAREGAAALRVAEQEADTIRARAAERLDAYVERVLQATRATLVGRTEP